MKKVYAVDIIRLTQYFFNIGIAAISAITNISVSAYLQNCHIGTPLLQTPVRIRQTKKMQLDIGVSPPANIMTFRPGLTYLTFDLDP